ncbi:hypothetical protein E5720_17235 [Rhodococcus sp. PAMC28707]|uniref:T3SS (YopN, CesT) and YbjN peptide-binding chaperone 1 n=1 Tax=unclassified Rhodococcus (in: high G+C Gram-positive bacteria) TaxID=192944 RepID=UPI00109DA8C6|nr:MULTISPECIES: hypothetical protein [unclassified Rhodococcus (in: high G+C Gram-positive bacteria)]QCB51854.1 hypothetical protein E5769_18285 [Rhodococcus sp. PAMC28705]QCB59977.1 hypothetical protein E5720_17235 [Rhodococcus sp. PAMC28707]
MSTFEVRELDSSMEKDWRRFAAQLGDRLASGEYTADWSLSPAFRPEGADKLEMSLRTTMRRTLVCVSSGLSNPPSPWRESGVSDIHVLEDPVLCADRFASTVVTQLRRTWNIPHPSFLVGTQDGSTVEGVFGVELLGDAGQVYEPMTSSVHADEEALSKAARRALQALHGPEIHMAADGSFTVPLGKVTAHVYVAALDEVRVDAPIVERIGGRTRAAEVVGDLNRRHPRLTFLLIDDRIHLTSSIAARPFVPQHLMDAVTRLADFVTRVDDDFATDLGGRLSTSPFATGPGDVPDDPTEDEVPAQLMTLLELDAELGGTIDAEDVVSVCGRDQMKISRYERFCVEQSQSWKECARDARLRNESAAASEYAEEAVPWDRVIEALRSALRTVGFYDNA